jgi:hypothetical protein
VADGWPRGAELRVGGHRHRGDPGLCRPLGARDRQFLCRPRALCALRAVAALDHRRTRPGLARRRTSSPTSPPPHSRATSRCWRRDRSLRRSRSSSSAPTAVGSSTSTPLTLRARRRSQTCSRWSTSAAPGRILLHLGQDGARRPPGLGKLTPLLRLGIATRSAEDFGRPRAFRAALARSISACLASSIAWSSLAVVLRSFEAVSVMPSCLIAQPNAETQPDYSRDRQPPTVASALQTTS